ncbi:MAG: family 78 glycoside hydrolase catalytic domain [Saccharofermentanales bacterium]
MFKVFNLKCEYKQNPIGIDAEHPRFFWMLSSDRQNTLQVAYQIQVASNDEFLKDILWDTGKLMSDRSVHIEYEGDLFKSTKRYFYRIRSWDNHGNISSWSDTAFFETGILDKNLWQAKWVTSDIYADAAITQPCPMFRTVFEIEKEVRYACAYVTSLGVYELHLNGSRIGDMYFTPGWTSYNKILQYQTFDITSDLNKGMNAIGAILGDGWYAGNLGWTGRRNIYGDKLALLMQLQIEYKDGSTQVIGTDTRWKTSTGPILKSEIYHGESFNAMLEKNSWDKAEYDDSDWEKVKIIDKKFDTLVAQINEPVKKIEEIKPLSIITTPKNEYVIDFGQNMVGWVKFKVSGKSGERVILKHAEILDKDGNFYIDNLRSAKQTIEYILKGTKEAEFFEPHFTFQGFRYVKVEEYPGIPNAENFTGVVLHSDMEQTGSFECSNKLINALQHNILWGQKGNFLDVPTDCPQRDERCGWTGDAQAFIRTSCYNMNTMLFFEKWLNDLNADQLKDGAVPFVVPQVLDDNYYSAAGWGDAAAICPWTLYLCYGDLKILVNQYESIKSWVEYIKNQGDNEYLWNTGYQIGDWLALDAKEGSFTGATSTDMIATAFYAYSCEILVKVARTLKKENDVEIYSSLHSNIIKAFRNEFVTPSGRLSIPTQTAHVLALMFNLMEDKDKERTVKTLNKYLEDNNYHLTTGFLGTPYLCHVLSDAGYIDIAYKLLLQEDFPSWLYPVKKGATTIWEHWDGIKPDGTFWNPEMNSFNHYAYGAIGDWLYRVVAGLNTSSEKPGYKHIIIKPKPGGNLDYAKAKISSMNGDIKSEWKIENEVFTIKVEIPCNTTAEVILPDDKKILIGSGNYEFSSTN